VSSSDPADLRREVVDLERLAAWMDVQGLEHGPLRDPVLMGGGTQNVLLRFRRGSTEFVLRRPPEHKRPNSDETMRREARLLGALASTDVPHPGLIAACPDVEVLGAAFYLMEPIDGFNPRADGLPDAYLADRGLVHQMGLAMADGIAALGSVDHVAVGLDDFGKPDGWLERQVDRWGSQYASYRDTPGFPGDALPGVEDLASWLDAHRPARWRPGIMHGDYHLGNVMFRYAEGRLAAIIDWELATIGDPLLDLGHLLAMWPRREGRDGAVVVNFPGLPPGDELVTRYFERSDRELTSLAFYRVLACYRLAIILEGTHARAYAGKVSNEAGQYAHDRAVAVLQRAHRVVAEAADR
jgi:aminoglycoside phosphotransferase (APT) family kinase protein